MKKGMTIIYPEYQGLYINLTNRCPCACTFCIRQRTSKAEFDNVDTLWLEREPTPQYTSEPSAPSFGKRHSPPCLHLPDRQPALFPRLP